MDVYRQFYNLEIIVMYLSKIIIKNVINWFHSFMTVIRVQTGNSINVKDTTKIQRLQSIFVDLLSDHI